MSGMSGDGRGGDRAGKRQGAASYRWWVLVTVVFGVFASILDTTIVNTALPKIQRSFQADLHLASYVVTGYILAAGVVVPLSGFLANRFGIKRIYLGSLALFTVFSALCGIAPNMLLLILFRVLQGAGGAALFPLSFALLFAAFSEDERGKANGIFGIPVLVAPAIGPTLGGYLSQFLDWRYVFFVNVPIGIIGVIMGWRVLHTSEPDRERRLDLWGFILAAGGVGLLLFGLSNFAYDSFSSVRTVSGPLVAGVVLLAIFVPVELRRAQPLLDLRLYGRRNYGVGNAITVLASISIFGPAFLLPQYLQELRYLTPFGAGLLLLWQGVGSVISTVISGRLYNRVGVRLLIWTGGAILIITAFLLAIWSTATSPLNLLPWILLLRGLGTPVLLQNTNTASLQGIEGRTLPEATTLNVVARNVVASLSIAVLTNILQQRTLLHAASLGKKALNAAGRSASSSGHVPKILLDPRAMAYHDVYVVIALTIVPVLILGFFMRSQRSKGGQESGDADRAEKDREQSSAAR